MRDLEKRLTGQNCSPAVIFLVLLYLLINNSLSEVPALEHHGSDSVSSPSPLLAGLLGQEGGMVELLADLLA